MSQSCAIISNESVLDLEKILNPYVKEHHLITFHFLKKCLLKIIKMQKILYEFLIIEQNYQNVKLSTKITHIKAICLFNQYIHYKDFEKITKNDIMDYLNSLRKTELDDPNHKWIGTYNTRQMAINKFFRWLYKNYQ